MNITVPTSLQPGQQVQVFDPAELVELRVPDHFTPTRLVFDQDTPQQREVDGFLTQHIRETKALIVGYGATEEAKVHGWQPGCNLWLDF